MHDCEAYRAQMLDSLYDLLDEQERQALAAHVATCPACQAEMEKARRQQALLAAAARMEFPDIRFTAPAETPTATPTLPLSVPGARPRRLRRWLAAAAVLLALGGLATAGAWYTADYRQARRLAEAQEQELASARELYQSAHRQLAELPREHQQAQEKLQRDLNERQLRVTVTGKPTVQAGAPADFQVEAWDFNNQPARARVSAQMLDNGQPLGKSIEGVEAAPGRYRVTLPPDLPIRPGSHPTLVVSARRAGGPAAELSAPLELDTPVYLTHLATDKPMYLPGETVHFRSLTLDRASFRPAQENLRLIYTLTLPDGNQVPVAQGGSSLVREGTGGPVVVNGPDGKPLRGIGAGEYKLPDGAPGGEYTLSVREEQGRFPEQKRKFLVNNFQKPRLNKELDFNRTTYGPGDDVAALCKATTSDNRPLANTPVTAVVQIDGHTYGADGNESGQPLSLQTDAGGKVTVRFKLPARIERGQASLAVTFQDEVLIKPIPIVVKKLDVAFYPEGGYLVAGLPNRVYFEVRTPLGKPAEIKGRLLDDGKPLDVAVVTAHDDKEPGVNKGLGLFEFTPQAGHHYEVEVQRPAGISQRFALPKIEADRVVLSVPGGVFDPEQAIPVVLHSARRASFLVGAYCRGRLLDTAQVDPIHFDKGTARVELHPSSAAGGVCRVTVFEMQGPDREHRQLRPVAERLIYRRPAQRLDMKLEPDRKAYVPRQHVELGVSASDEKGEPAPAVVLLAVVDKSVVTLADDKTARAMPTHFLLTTEVRRPEDMEYADFLLGKHPRSAEVLDLLLGTQGWRRFAEQDPDKFRRENPEDGERLVMMTGQSMNKVTDLGQEQHAKIDREFASRQAQLTQQIEQAEQEDHSARESDTYKAALVKLADYDDFFDKTRRFGAPLAGMVLLSAAVVLLVVAAMRRLSGSLPYLAGLAGSALGLALVATLYLEQKAGNAQVARGPAPPPPLASSWTATMPAGGGQGAVNEELARKEDEMAPRMAPQAGAAGGPGGDARLGAARMAMPMAKGVAQPVPPPPGPPGAPPDANRALDPKGREALRMEQARLGDKAGADGRGAKDAGKQLQQPDAAMKEAGGQFRVMAKRLPPARPFVPAGDLRRRAAFGGRGLADRPRDIAPGEMNGEAASPPLVVREYTHRMLSGDSAPRRDETDTLYWDPVLVLSGGKAVVSFDLSDAVTSFEVTAFAHTTDGRLGAATRLIESRLPLTLRPKTPLEVTASDRIELPLAVTNSTDQEHKVRLALLGHDNLKLLAGADDELAVGPQATVRRFYHFQPTAQEGEARVLFQAQAGPILRDDVERSFRIVPEGFPLVGAQSDLLEGSATGTVTLPPTWINGTLHCKVSVYPSTLADLQKGLEAMLQEPGGCFEQTSTSNYPNLLVLDYLRESGQDRPEVERRARDMLARGYERLTSFECLDPSHNTRQGYEWFGGTAPAHEALTAYGLMEFRDMARVHDVDAAMLKRTHDYLLARRDGKGGFQRNPRALDSFGAAPEDVTNAYIVWAITESGKDDDINRELDSLAKKAETSKDPYFLSLVANSLINRARTPAGTALLRKVAAAQKDDGHLDGETTSITHSGGRDLQIETTALAVLGWLKANPAEFHQPLYKAIRWIGQQRGGYGGFGSTQATILALKALIGYTKANKKTAEAGTLQMFVNDRPVARLDFPAGASDALELTVPDAEKTLQPGRNKVRIEVTGKNSLPYTLAWSYRTLQPASAEGCAVRLETALARSDVQEGDSVRLTVKLANVSGQGQGMAVAIVGLPAGLGLPEDLKQLKEYARVPTDGSRPLLGAFEVRGRELVLYWRDLAPAQKIEVPVDLVCRVPGEYSGPASRAYLYYNADHKHWVAPLKVKVAPKAPAGG
jgi:hypothetical protein